jgi:hypothetical protein
MSPRMATRHARMRAPQGAGLICCGAGALLLADVRINATEHVATNGDTARKKVPLNRCAAGAGLCRVCGSRSRAARVSVRARAVTGAALVCGMHTRSPYAVHRKLGVAPAPLQGVTRFLVPGSVAGDAGTPDCDGLPDQRLAPARADRSLTVAPLKCFAAATYFRGCGHQ